MDTVKFYGLGVFYIAFTALSSSVRELETSKQLQRLAEWFITAWYGV